MRASIGVMGVMLVGGLMAACAEPANDQPESAGEPAEAATEVAQPAADTTAAALWSHLQDERYRENWTMWPGKGQLYTGTEPHGMLLTTYANDVAYDALLNGQAASLPAGSIIVKENYMPDSTFAAATVMYKVPGYNPEHQDWLFAKYDPQGAPEDFGRAAMCQACHQQAASGYVYTAVQR
jgi:hypothetical protein